MFRAYAGTCGKTASETFSREEQQLRCGCGNLLARVTSEGIELKCRRCKRVCLIPISKGDFEKLFKGNQILNQKDQRPLSPESKKEKKDGRDSEAGSTT